MKTDPEIIINNYANSMFVHEYLNERWVFKCSEYLKELFDNIEGKVVVDYAFGRGNWSLAFLKAGAKKVYSIDASTDACLRFSQYCSENNINNIEVINQDIVNKPIDIDADIIWVYGILHHINKLDLFLCNVKRMAANKAQFYFYYYNKNSLRRVIVSACRKLYKFSESDPFEKNSWLFLRNSKNRASDDLVAPYTNWKTMGELCKCLSESGFSIHRTHDQDFYEYVHHKKNQEFEPLQVMCSLGLANELDMPDTTNFQYKIEIEILENILESLLLNKIFSIDERKKICIGIYNTHFVNSEVYNIERVLIENFIFCMRALLIMDTDTLKKIPLEVQNYRQLLMASMKDLDRKELKNSIGSNIYTDFLYKNIIRM
jgi:ubiquinone/menaquinone biosynthesis C-methylase UbiE